MRTIERAFDDLCTWYIGNHERGAHVIDSQKRYEFVCKALSCIIEMQGLLLQELQIVNRRTVDGSARIRMPGGKSIAGEVRHGD